MNLALHLVFLIKILSRSLSVPTLASWALFNLDFSKQSFISIIDISVILFTLTNFIRFVQKLIIKGKVKLYTTLLKNSHVCIYIIFVSSSSPTRVRHANDVSFQTFHIHKVHLMPKFSIPITPTKLWRHKILFQWTLSFNE